jgi:hypothetical protein
MPIQITPFGSPVAGDDSTGFDVLERRYVRRILPDFDWLSFDTPSPRRPLPAPLRHARVGLVVTAGAHLPDQPAFAMDGEVRFLDADRDDFVLTHIGYDTGRAMSDPSVVVPVRPLQRLVRAGVIGSLAPTVISTMGLVPRGMDVLERSAPAAAERLSEEEVDLALLVPA